MRLSQLLGNRFKERPAEAVIESHAFLLRGGYIRQMASGIFSMLPPGLRVLRNIEGPLREEMEHTGFQEVLMPMVLPAEPGEASGREAAAALELMRLTDRAGHRLMLANAHEAAVAHLCRHELTSHAQLPCAVFQIQTKFRDEAHARGGLIRAREFATKDAYSFHADAEDLRRFYAAVCAAYLRVFRRMGLPQVVQVESDSGGMGGCVAHAFMLLTEAGEDTIVTNEAGTYWATLDVATGLIQGYPCEAKPLEKVHTPGFRTIEEVAGFLGVPARQTAKAVFYDADAEGRLVLALIRGDREVNEAKVARLIGRTPVPAGEDRIRAAGAEPGYASPMGLDERLCRVLVDHSVATSGNLVTGANERDYHFRNFNLARDLAPFAARDFAPAQARDLGGAATVDIATVDEGDACHQGGALAFRRGIALGHTAQIGTQRTASMQMTFTDAEGRVRVPVMGSYAIGVGRLMSAILEAHHDRFGPIWPVSVAPWRAHIHALKLDAPGVRETAERLYAALTAAGIDSLYDDRDARPGVQFADADLLGAPYRFIVGERHLAEGRVEWKRRATGESGTLPLEGAVAAARAWIEEDLKALG